MKKLTKTEFNLRVGNLLLAIFLSTVQTAITYGVVGIHGINVCQSATSKINFTDPKIKDICRESSWETTRSYILIIGFFITLPTWLWFYLSVKKK